MKTYRVEEDVSATLPAGARVTIHQGRAMVVMPADAIPLAALRPVAPGTPVRSEASPPSAEPAQKDLATGR